MKILVLIFSLKKIPTLSWSSFDELNFKPRIITLLYLVIGLILFGLGETMLIAANAGVSPWTVLAQGISIKTGYSIGISTFIVSIGVLILWIPLKQKPGIGTILNTIIISIVLDVSLPYLPTPESFFLQALQVFIGVIIVGLGSGFYLISNLGPGSRDGLMTGLQKKTNLPIALIRATIEVSAVVFGFYLGGVVGIGTLVFAFGIGPAVSAGLFFVSRFFK
ncbi:MAG: YitT family protein [Alphaproteobacteria bacterium]|nr:YitT family protein [Alphaproteobacteria bacterium]